MKTKISDIIQETKRLKALSTEERKQEGIYADTAQLKFLLKKLNSYTGKISFSAVNGLEKFISDFSSSDSIILILLDNLEKCDA
jgi:hypothetical protein